VDVATTFGEEVFFFKGVVKETDLVLRGEGYYSAAFEEGIGE